MPEQARTGFFAIMSLGDREGGREDTHKSGDLLYTYDRMPREMVMIDTYCLIVWSQQHRGLNDALFWRR